MSDLLPCPFCGSKPLPAKHDHARMYVIRCSNCNVELWDTNDGWGELQFVQMFNSAWNRRALPAVQPATDPDYCYDEAWEYTMPWGDRDTLVEWADLTKPVPIYTLIKGPTKWAVNIPLDTDGDGEADDFELTWFDSEDAAIAALKGEGHE